METMQLPSRVVNVLAALRTQGYDMKFKQMASGNINVEVYKNDKYHTDCLLVCTKDYDMYDSEYEKMCNVIDPRVQKKSAAVLKYLEGIIEY
jgi:hypothetical protein